MEDHSSQWSVYDSMIQSYRSNSLASQSLMLAVGAVLYNQRFLLLFIAFLVAMFQMWYIWFRVIRVRSIISDFHKYAFKYNFTSFINKKGDLEEKPADPITEKIYLKDRKARKKANRNLAEKQNDPRLKYNFRMTRVKLDILLPLSFTFLWIILLLAKRGLLNTILTK